MASDIKIAVPQQIGPLQVWPLMWERLHSHQQSVPEGIDDLTFEECEEEDIGPVFNWIQVNNPTKLPVLIPSGWILSEGLLQDRTLICAEYIQPESTSTVMVSCVEKGRWDPSEAHYRSFRAPMSVMGAGFDFDSHKGLWALDSKNRQEIVWQHVEDQESRSGRRPTHSLAQIMQEDTETCGIQKNVTKITNENLKIYPDQNGVLLTLEGQPLVTEFFTNPYSMKSKLQKTIIASSFDAKTAKKTGIEKDVVKKFLDEILAIKIHTVKDEDWGVHLSGGTESLDTQISKNAEGRLLHFTSINRRHPALTGV